jgi:hypothetical protein
MTGGWSPLQGYVAGESKRLENKDFTEPGQDTGMITSPTRPGKPARAADARSPQGSLPAAAVKPTGYTTSALLLTRPAYTASRSAHQPFALRGLLRNPGETASHPRGG